MLLSVNKAVALALEIVAAKSVAFKLPSEFKLIPLPELLLELDELLELFDPLVELPLVLPELLPMLACSWTEALVGGLIPRGVHFIAAYFHQREIDNHFRGSFVEIADDLFRQENLVGRSPNYYGFL